MLLHYLCVSVNSLTVIYLFIKLETNVINKVLITYEQLLLLDIQKIRPVWTMDGRHSICKIEDLRSAWGPRVWKIVHCLLEKFYGLYHGIR